LETEKANVPLLEVALVIILTFFLSAFAVFFFLEAFGTGPALVFGELLFLVVPLIYLLLKRINIKSYVRMDLKPKNAFVGLASGIALFLLDIVVFWLLTSVFGTSQAVEETNRLLTETASTTLGLVMVATSLALAGVCEEFLFRGFLQNAVTRKYSFLPALAISAVVFGLFHPDLQLVYTLSAMASGVLLGLVYYRWGYVSAAVAHSTNNLVILALFLLGI
jgi:membrane protease YdiL (CAAX protease family)